MKTHCLCRKKHRKKGIRKCRKPYTAYPVKNISDVCFHLQNICTKVTYQVCKPHTGLE